MKRNILKYIRITILFFLIGFFSFVVYLILASVFDQSTPFQPRGNKVMLIVAHQDDGIIIAGAFCAENIKVGGEVLVVYTTDGAKGNAPILEAKRKQEAYFAWALAGVPKQNIIILGYDDFYGMQKRIEIKEAILAIKNLIENFKPDIIITSLYENGHYQHDVTNFIVGKSREIADIDCPIYEGPEYNIYFSFRNTPRKFLSAITSLIPFYQYYAPPEFIDNRQKFEFRMTDEHRLLKKKILAEFKTQDVNWLQRQFTIKERFQKYKGYDYSKSPFKYQGSWTEKITTLRKFPVLSYLFKKMFGDLSNIHPNPIYKFSTFSLEFCENTRSR